jgi:hypothetical protein
MRTIILISAMISGAGYLGLVPPDIMHSGMPVTWAAGALITMSMVFALAKG